MQNPNYGLSEVYNKYSSFIQTTEPVRVGIIDDGVNLSNDYVVEAWNAETKAEDTVSVNGHGNQVAGVAVSFAPSKIQVVSVKFRDDHWMMLDAITKAQELGCSVINISSNIPQTTMIASTMERLRMNDIIWTSHYSHLFNYPSYLLHTDVVARYRTKFSDFGKNVLVATGWNMDKDRYYGAYDKKIPSLGVYATAPSWAAPVLASAAAFLRLFQPELDYKEVANILNGSAETMESGDKFLRMNKAIELLTGESLTSVTVAPTPSSLIDRIEVHYKSGEVEILKQ